MGDIVKETINAYKVAKGAGKAAIEQEAEKLRDLMASDIKKDIDAKSDEFEEEYYYKNIKGDMLTFKATKYATTFGFDSKVKAFTVFEIVDPRLLEDYNAIHDNGSLIAGADIDLAFANIAREAGWSEEDIEGADASSFITPTTEKLTALQCATKIILDAITPKKKEPKAKKVRQPVAHTNLDEARADAINIRDPQLKKEAFKKIGEAEKLHAENKALYEKLSKLNKAINVATNNTKNKKDPKVRGQAKAQLDTLNKAKDELTQQIDSNVAEMKTLLTFSKKNNFSDLIARVKRVNNFALTGKYEDRDVESEYFEGDESEACPTCDHDAEIEAGHTFCPYCGDRLIDIE